MSGPIRTAATSGLQAKVNDRAQVQYSTTYNPGDLVLYNGERILITAAVTTGSGTNGLGQPFISAANYVKLTALGWFWASDYGVKADGSTDDWAALQNLLILVRSLTVNSSNGYKVILPTGQIMLSKPLILPTQTELVGQGLYSTVLKIMSGANCDVVQTERWNNSTQAGWLTTLSSSLTAGNLRNAFRWGIRDLCIHGNGTVQSASAYNHGLNVQPNPLLSTGTGDPDFDPGAIVTNVQFRACTGDGFFANGRSAMRLVNCVSWFNYGNGFTTSFDTQVDHSQAGFCGLAGFYIDHQAVQGAGNKSYNQAKIVVPWVTGQNWTALSRVIYNGVMYGAINATTADTVTPDADPTNWAPITPTNAAAWGVGVYFGPNSGEITFDCDCQQNGASNWYVAATSKGLRLSGCSDEPNFDSNTSLIGTTNPNHYAGLVLDGCQGVIASITTKTVGTAGSHLRLINGATKNDVTLAGDTSGTLLTTDSAAILGSGNQVRYNGVNYSQTIAAQNDAAITSPIDGQVLTFDAASGKWKNLPSGSTAFFGGVLGDGSAGSVNLDGTNTYAGITKAGSTYTLTADLHSTVLTIAVGVTLVVSGYRVFCQGTITNNGTISADGNAGLANGTGGAGTGSSLAGGRAGGAGQTTVGSVGTAGGPAVNAGGAGGAGASGAGGAGGTTSNATTSWYRQPAPLLTGVLNVFSGPVSALGGPGGGGGGGDTTNKGGGGGSGASIVAIFARSVANTGTITAKGGNGGTPTTGNAGGGGGGAGGLIVIYTLSAWTNTGTTNVAGGTAGTGVGTGATGVNGGNGNVVNFIVT